MPILINYLRIFLENLKCLIINILIWRQTKISNLIPTYLLHLFKRNLFHLIIIFPNLLQYSLFLCFQSAGLVTSHMPQTRNISFGLVSFCKTLFGPIRKMSEYWSSDQQLKKFLVQTELFLLIILVTLFVHQTFLPLNIKTKYKYMYDYSYLFLFF